MQAVMSLLLLVAMSPILVAGQSSKIEWRPEEMFNPLVEPRKCGLDTDKKSYVCDPNGILGDELDSFNWILRDAATNTTCPCSNYYCESNAGGETGYKIGLALVRKMELQMSPEGRRNEPKDQAQLFAYHLESNRWNMGSCEEDIVIFYSVEDGMLALFGGSTANAKLTPYYRRLLAYRVGSRFRDGRIVEALNNLIYDLKMVLNCDEELRMKGVDCGLHELRDGASVSSASLMMTAVFALIISLYNIIC